MKTKSTVSVKSSAWITLTGIILALLLCLLGTSMVMIIYPESSSYFKGVFDKESKLAAFEPATIFSAAQPTPFQPGPAYTPQPTPVPANPPQTAQQVAYVPPAQQSNSSEPQKEDVSDDTEDIPMSSYIFNLHGTPQLYTLDCESQSAVDWAQYFGITIDEEDFIDQLPHSDDPEKGFVGNINGKMGQLPPDDYGIHASPIAKMLRSYGLPAKAKHDWDFEGIKKEISNKRPVIVWIVNMPFAIDSEDYTAESTGNTTTVARFEHTWIITGYNASTVTVVDSKWTYNVNTMEFLDRWEALGSQAVIYSDN
jgi:uncharacterized protein YvpB